MAGYSYERICHSGLLGIVGLLVAGCMFEQENVGEHEGGTDSSKGALRETWVPAFDESVVAGVAQRVVAGRAVEARALQAAAVLPQNIEELLLTGRPDAQGFVYESSVGASSRGDGEEVRFQKVVRRPLRQTEKGLRGPKLADFGGATPASSRVTKKIGASLDRALQSETPDKLVEVYVRLRQRFSTSLDHVDSTAGASLFHAERQLERRRARLDARKNEANQLQAPLRQSLRDLGATSVSGFWTSNGLAVTLPLGAVKGLALHPDVAHVSLPEKVGEHSATKWDGDDMKASGGLNAGAYHDNGFHGEAFSDNAGGRLMRIAVIGAGFLPSHPGFDDSAGGASRVVSYMDCTQNPCASGATGTSPHAHRVAGYAAGSLRQGQISGLTNQVELEHTGVAEEPNVYLLKIDGLLAAKRAIEWAIDADVDVLASSSDFAGSACDGEVGQDLELTAYEAQVEGVLIVQSAGNEYDGSGVCTNTGLSEAPSVFSVGWAGSSSSSCTKNNWSSCDLASQSSKGGMDATVDGVTYPEVLTLLSAVAPGCPAYQFTTAGGITTHSGCGTSYAAPQVAGAAVQVKDYFLDQGFSDSTIDRLFAVVLAMTDRANSASSYRSNRLHSRWGGGRFQARFFNASDLGGPWGWEAWNVALSDGQTSDHVVFDSGAEPSGISQYKVYGVVLEESNQGISDIDIALMDQNCSGTVLETDDSRDVKMMARVGSTAASKALCVRSSAFHVPGGTKRIHLFGYYSSGTSMR